MIDPGKQGFAPPGGSASPGCEVFMDLLKQLLSDKTLKGVAILFLFGMLLCLRYWAGYYDQFSLEILNLTSPSDLLGLSIAKLRFTIALMMIAAVPLGSVLLQMWATPKSGGSNTAIGCLLMVGIVALFFAPGEVVDRAAKNDARLVRNGGKPSWISTVAAPLDVTIENKDGSHSDRCRWIGATSSYIFVLGPDSSRRVMKRDEVKSLNFSPVAKP
jgi:hypothetical protein